MNKVKIKSINYKCQNSTSEPLQYTIEIDHETCLESTKREWMAFISRKQGKRFTFLELLITFFDTDCHYNYPARLDNYFVRDVKFAPYNDRIIIYAILIQPEIDVAMTKHIVNSTYGINTKEVNIMDERKLFDMNFMGVFPRPDKYWVRDKQTDQDRHISNAKYKVSGLNVKKIIFNGPATIVIFKDGTKSVVKASENDPWSKEAGVALALLKHKVGDEYFHIVLKALVGDSKSIKIDVVDTEET